MSSRYFITLLYFFSSNKTSSSSPELAAINLKLPEQARESRAARNCGEESSGGAKEEYSFASVLPSFLSNRNRSRSFQARQWPPMVERVFFSPPRRVQTTYRSLSTREREKERDAPILATGAHVNGTTRVVEYHRKHP